MKTKKKPNRKKNKNQPTKNKTTTTKNHQTKPKKGVFFSMVIPGMRKEDQDFINRTTIMIFRN